VLERAESSLQAVESIPAGVQIVRRRVLATSLATNDTAELASLDPAAFWLGPTCVVRTTSRVGPLNK
jgi:hypothetical protein